jgi:hypothetical protein
MVACEVRALRAAVQVGGRGRAECQRCRMRQVHHVCATFVGTYQRGARGDRWVVADGSLTESRLPYRNRIWRHST